MRRSAFAARAAEPRESRCTEIHMRPTEILSGEHRVIEVVLGVLDRMAQDAFERGVIDVPAARETVGFIREFADRRHHGKEEARLFPAMESAGLPPHHGPTAVMRHEHEVGRAEVRRMDAALRDFEDAKGGAADAFAFAARTFVDFLREHIAKEDEILFPMADRILGDDAQTALLAEFQRFDGAEFDAADHDRWVAFAEDLAARFGVPSAHAAAPHGGHHGGGCHDPHCGQGGGGSGGGA